MTRGCCLFPTQFATRWTLKSSSQYFWNRYLCMYKGEDCIQETRNITRKDKARAIVGIALALMGSISVYWKKFRAKQRLRERRHLNKDQDSMVFTLPEIMEATQNFRQILGRGGFGKVFFGRLPDGKEIAVKLVSSTLGIQEFFTEVDLVSRVHHKNLVSLLGYCFAKSGQPLVIFSNISEGSLMDHLYDQSAGLPKLNWKSRLKIAIDAAEGLQYLHVCCTPMIIHRDVTSANILLDSDLNGKLVNFSLSKMTMDRKAPIVDMVKGTYGYADPEYLSTGLLTQKTDVYSFGVVLLEIICGRKAYNKDLPADERLLSTWVRDYAGINENPGKIGEIIDNKMEGKYHMKSITIVAKVALRCLQNSSRRPSISEVVGELKEAFMFEIVGRAL